MKARHCVVLYRLDSNDEGYAAGARFRMDTQDNTQFYFRNMEGSNRFMELHGLLQIKESEMNKMRLADRKETTND